MSEEAIVDYESMSDEDFMKLEAPTNTPEVESQVEEVEPEQEIEESSEIEEEVVEEEPQQEESEEVEATEETPGEEAEQTSEESTDEVDTPVENKYAAIEEALKTPFKYGKSEITINSAEDLVVLAKKGLGANKRIQELAPKIKIADTLEANGISEERMNFLIALDKKDPAAIKELVRTSGIDSFDLTNDEVADEKYVPKDYAPLAEDTALNNAISEVSGTESFPEFVETLKSLDEASKTEIRKNPNIIQELSGLHESGHYKELNDIVVKERLLGRLPGMSDLAAQKHVWNTIQEYSASKSGNSEAGNKNGTDDRTTREDLASTEGTQEAGHKVEAGKRVDKARKAAEATNKSTGSKTPSVIDLDKLSDEEFLKLDISDIT